MARTKKLPPNHPDEFLRDEIMPAGGLTQDALARMLDVSGRTVNEIVTEKRRVSANMARRLARGIQYDTRIVVGTSNRCRSLESGH